MDLTDIIFVAFVLSIIWSLMNNSGGGGRRSRVPAFAYRR